MDFIYSINCRQAHFNALMHPHINDINAEDSLGLYNFTLSEVISPTQELLFSIDKTLGIGYFNTSLKVYKLAGIQFREPFDKYQIFISTSTDYIELKTYLSTKDARVIYVEDSLYIVCNRYIPIEQAGIVLVTLNKNLYSFTNVAGEDTIHLYKNLYIKTSIPFTQAKNTSGFKLINTTFNSSGDLVDGSDLATEVALFYAEDQDKILSNGAIVVFTYNGEYKFRLIDLSYVFWNRELGIIDKIALKNRLANLYGAQVDSIVSISVLLQTVDVDKIVASQPENIFKELFRLSKEPKYKLTNIVKNETIGLTPIDGYSRLMDINFGIDMDYFDSIKSISRRVARTLIGNEFSKLHYNIDISTINNDGITFIVHNKYQSEVSVFINGFYYHGSYIRNDKLSLSTITINKADLDTYGKIDYIEAVVEPTFTQKYNVLTKRGHNNLLEVHGSYTLDSESDLYINGCLYDKSFYKYMNIEGRGFVSIEKDVIIQEATIVYNNRLKYDRVSLSSLSELQDYSIIDEYSKVFISGRLVPIKFIIDLYDDKKIDFLSELNYADNRDNKITLIQIKDNPVWNNLLKGADTDSLITGFLLVDTTKSLFKHVPYSEIIKRIKTVTSTNSMKNSKYSIKTHSTTIMQRSECIYDILTIGKKMQLDCNTPSMTIDMSTELVNKYPNLILGKCLILDANSEVTPMLDVQGLMNV